MNTKMNWKKLNLINILWVAFFIVSCGEQYQTTEKGMKYKLHHQEDGPAPEKGDIIEMHIVYKQGDTAITNSYRDGEPVLMRLKEASYKGDIMDGLAKLGIGDSATFHLDPEEVHGDFVPKHLQENPQITYHVKILDFWNEDEKIDDFIEKEGLEMERTESGLRYNYTERGDGASPEKGDYVTTHFTGKLLDGEVFESSYDDEPFSFTAGYDHPVKGWDEMVMKMQEGDKAQVLIPSSLAYKEGGTDFGIPPFATLFMEIELLEVSEREK